MYDVFISIIWYKWFVFFADFILLAYFVHCRSIDKFAIVVICDLIWLLCLLSLSWYWIFNDVIFYLLTYGQGLRIWERHTLDLSTWNMADSDRSADFQKDLRTEARSEIWRSGYIAAPLTQIDMRMPRDHIDLSHIKLSPRRPWIKAARRWSISLHGMMGPCSRTTHGVRDGHIHRLWC